MPEIKKTLVIGINLHGEIPLDENNNPQTMQNPNNFIIKLNVVTPGVPNISTFENYNKLDNVTRGHVKQNKWLNDVMISSRLQANYKDKMIHFVDELKNAFIEENKENVEGVEKEYFRKGSIAIKHHQNFVHYTDNMYTINTFNKGDTITNKLFYKFSDDELDSLGIEEDDNNGFNKIVIYNFSNDGIAYDLFALLGPNFTQITLFQLIDFFTGMGVENLIIIDSSCSVFSSENKLSNRNVRNVRRKMNLSQIYGGTMKKTYKKCKKCKKNKKYKKTIKRRRHV